MNARGSGLAEALRRIAPRLPRYEFAAVLDHAQASRTLQTAAPESAAWLALTAYTRHALTDYDALLAQGYDRDSARHFVADAMDEALAGWGVPAALRARITDAE